MLGQLFADLRGEPVAGLDLDPGEGSLTRQLRTNPTSTVGELLADRRPVPLAAYGVPATARPAAEVIASGEDRVAVRALDERDYAELVGVLAGRYDLTIVDPAAATVARCCGSPISSCSWRRRAPMPHARSR